MRKISPFRMMHISKRNCLQAKAADRRNEKLLFWKTCKTILTASLKKPEERFSGTARSERRAGDKLYGQE